MKTFPPTVISTEITYPVQVIHIKMRIITVIPWQHYLIDICREILSCPSAIHLKHPWSSITHLLGNRMRSSPITWPNIYQAYERMNIEQELKTLSTLIIKKNIDLK